MGGQEVVLRKQPPGKLLPSAHNVAREYRIISALARTAVPVPQALSLCTDAQVLGEQFYLMQFVDGVVHTDAALPDLSAPQRQRAYHAMAGASAGLPCASLAVDAVASTCVVCCKVSATGLHSCCQPCASGCRSRCAADAPCVSNTRTCPTACKRVQGRWQRCISSNQLM